MTNLTHKMLTFKQFYHIYNKCIVIMKKVCSKCKNEKSTSLFGKSVKSIDGFQHYCKECQSLYSKQRRKDNPSLVKAEARRNYLKNGRKREQILRQTDENYVESKRQYNREYYKENADTLIDYQKYLRSKGLNKYSETRRKYDNKRYVNDPLYRLHHIVSSHINKHFRSNGSMKFQRTEELLNYKLCEIHKVLGEPMKGDEIDHKIPKSWFIADTPIRIIWHLSNLQYLQKAPNVSKSNKYADAVCSKYYKIAKPYVLQNRQNELKLINE